MPSTVNELKPFDSVSFKIVLPEITQANN